MLELLVPMSEETYNEETKEFSVDVFKLELEHSLAALSKWESRMEKPFLSEDKKTTEEVVEYVRCMTLTPNVPPEVYQNLSPANYQALNDYIDSKQTATWFSDGKSKKPTKPSEVITAEIIYFWLSSFNIPWEVQHWHLNKLMTLLRVYELKQSKPEKKKFDSAAMADRRALNAQRKADMKTRG